MAASNMNVVVLTGNLTKDPELRATGGGTSVVQMRLAVNTRAKMNGEWGDKAHYFDIVAFGAMADNCGQYLARGRPIAVEGRLDWREWEAKDGSGKRQAVQVIANNVQFLNSREDSGEQTRPKAQPSSQTDLPAPDTSDWGYGGTSSPTPTGSVEDDIPF